MMQSQLLKRIHPSLYLKPLVGSSLDSAATSLHAAMTSTNFAENIQDIGETVSLQARVNRIAPILNAQIDEFEGGNAKEGVQSFQVALRMRIRRANCSRIRWIPVRRVGAHPHNREKTGIVPIDMHDLLRRMTADGWNWELVDALACEMPPAGVMV